MRAKRRFIDGRFGQIHVRAAGPEKAQNRPLACLHMSPKSGRVFARFIERASDDRLVFAHDYPGFGESDPPPSLSDATIDNYAQSLWDVVDGLRLGEIDVLGYHTGSEVAVEAARQRPGRVGRIILVSAPVFTAEETEVMKRTYATIPLDEAGTRFRKIWQGVLAHRGPGTTLEMMAMSFAENLRAGENYEWGHHAAFDYAPRFPDSVKSLDHRIVVLNPNDDLAEYTPRVAPLLQNGEIIDCLNWGHGFLDAYTEDAVGLIKSILS